MATDPAGWLEMLERVRKLNPAGLVATRGEPTKLVFQELEATRLYLDRVVRFLAEQKAKDAPEARVAAELSIRKIGEYCPSRSDNANVLALYRRMQPDGSFAPLPPPTLAGPARDRPGARAALTRARREDENPGRLSRRPGRDLEGDGSSELTIALFRVSRVRGPSSLRGVDLGSPRKEPFVAGKELPVPT